jgi:hypothetical protein
VAVKHRNVAGMKNLLRAKGDDVYTSKMDEAHRAQQNKNLLHAMSLAWVKWA